jgi:hypothetical protein
MLFAGHFVALPLLLLANGQEALSQSSEAKQARDASQKLIGLHLGWGAKANPPDASLTIKEQSHSGGLVIFRLYAKGLPKGVLFDLAEWPVTQASPSKLMGGVTLDESGVAICAGTPGTCGSPDKPNDTIDLVFSPVPGEPIRLALVSGDGATRVYARLVPEPLRGEDRGCTVDATLLTPRAELVLIEGTGFPANSELVLDSESEGERHAGPGKVGADGRYVGAVLPHKLGVPFGTVKVVLKSAKCSPSVKIPWGQRPTTNAGGETNSSGASGR